MQADSLPSEPSGNPMKIMVTSFKRPPACSATFNAPNPAASHYWPTPPLETLGHSRASLGQSLVGSLLLFPGSWYARGSVCALQESVSKAFVSPGSSMVGLMATSSKRAYAIPWSAAPRAPQSPCGRPLTHISAGEVKWTFGSITTKKLVEVMEFQLSYSKS